MVKLVLQKGKQMQGLVSFINSLSDVDIRKSKSR